MHTGKGLHNTMNDKKPLERILLVPIAILALIICFTLIYAYANRPSELRIQLADSPADRLRDLIEIAIQEGTDINKDPYSASTYKPSDALYKPMLEIQQGNFKQAKKSLEGLVKKDNINAMFWLAVVETKLDKNNNIPAKLFKEAAEKGNPYAALILNSKQEYGCQVYDKSICNETWGNKAQEILKARAEKGDAKAGFALYLSQKGNKPNLSYLIDNKDKGPLSTLIKATKDGIRQHYYRPLNELVDLYKLRKSLSPFNDDYLPNSEDLTKADQAVLNLIKRIAVNNNYVPLIAIPSNFYPNRDTTNFKRLIDYLWSNNIDHYALIKYYFNKPGKKRNNLIEGYAHALSNSAQKTYSIDSIRLLSSINQAYFSKKDKKKARTLAKKYLKTTPPILIKDEFEILSSSNYYWLR